MQLARGFQLIIALFGLAVAWPPAIAQVVIATIPAGASPNAVAVNSVTNQIYVTNRCGSDPSCASPGTVTVIDGATNNTATVSAGYNPQGVAVNSVTNQIYVTNRCGGDPSCASPGTVTVIDGATNNTTTVSVGYKPQGVAVNSVTDQIYVTNRCGSDPGCASNGTVTVIDGATKHTTTVSVGASPSVLGVNSVTNQIYVVNSGQTVTVIDGATNNTLVVTVGLLPYSLVIDSLTNRIYVVNTCGKDPLCNGPGTVTVIDGASNNIINTVQVGKSPHFAAVNPVTNQIYVTNGGFSGGNTVTVIDGTTFSTSTVSTGTGPWAVAVNSATNKIYVTDVGSADVTMIDGATNSVVYVGVGNAPVAEAVNTVTNRIYVASTPNNTVSVIAGANAPPLQFVAVTPCRLLDTRNSGGPIQGGTSQTLNLPQLAQAAGCANLSSAAAYSLNPTVVPQGPLGYLTIWPTGEDQPNVSTLNSPDGRVKANAAIVPAGYQGAVSVFVSNTTDLVLDIDGYFAPPGGSTLAFYSLPPCRVVDTRNANGDLGGPYLSGGVPRDFPVLNSPCFPQGLNPAAYSYNFTVVPHVPLGYLTVWPADQPQPVVSTLNALTGTVVANAAIVPASKLDGDIKVLASNDTDLVVDINGYFAAPGGQYALSLYPAAPCRVLDTRQVGNGRPFVGKLIVDVVDSACAPTSTAQAYVFNASVVPSGPLGYLTLWPDGTPQPAVATLNAVDGAVTSNMAIVPTNNGSIDAYASNLTQLILDISSYFAP
jgi:DNA-binding beta-propeller fold protein YncE